MATLLVTRTCKHGFIVACDKMIIIKYSTVGTIPQSNIKILERGKIDISNTQIHDVTHKYMTSNTQIHDLYHTNT